MNRWLELLPNDDYISIKQYLKNGANLEETNETGESILACAIREKCDFETLLLLVENGANIKDFDEEGVSIFDMAITYNNFEMVQYLINQGIDVNMTNRRSGFTALMAAVCYGRKEITKLLLESGVNQNAKDSKGFKAVDFARKMNKKSLLALLDFIEEAPQNRGYAK